MIHGEYVTFSSVQHNVKIINPGVQCSKFRCLMTAVVCGYVLQMLHRIQTSVLAVL